MGCVINSVGSVCKLLTYIDQLVKDTGCRTEELPAAMKERDKWKERVINYRASSTW